MLTLYEETVRDLKQHPQSADIKKLVLAACRQRWIGDASVVARYRLEDLLDELRQANPTLQDLSVSLRAIVSKLNKRGKYSAIANTIFWKVGRLYERIDRSTMCVFLPTGGASEEARAIVEAEQIAKVADELERQPELLRIKKLLVCVCDDHWENDAERLEEIYVEDLVQKLYRTHATIDQLSISLFRAVKTLNKQAQYFLIAKAIVGQMRVLYETSEEIEAVESMSVARPGGFRPTLPPRPSCQSQGAASQQYLPRTAH